MSSHRSSDRFASARVVSSRTALIGHRGVGKTALLARLQGLFGTTAICYDLDREIRERAGLDLQEIFASQGEEAFRILERKTFAEIDAETADNRALENGPDIYVALGAGFDPALIPATWKVLWIRRSTDEAGRIFMDRPRLNARVAALEEFHERYHRRHKAYRERADQILWLDEGIEEASDPAEQKFFLNELRDIKAAITLLPEMMKAEASFAEWASERLAWGVRAFELRDDLLSEEQMKLALKTLPDEKILVSFRDPQRRSATSEFVEKSGLAFDWPLEFGECDQGDPLFLSLHERREGESISEALARFPRDVSQATSLKAALPTQCLKELLEGDAWQAADAQNRSFLPHSTDGRWSWYRLRQLGRQPLSFFREGDGSGVDQPTLLQVARVGALVKSFAAVLGDPVKHSRTPMEHQEFFTEKTAPVFFVRVTEPEMRAGAILQLQQLGLRWAAVTAPLKELAFAACTEVDEAAKRLAAVNTLFLDERRVIGANTDLQGLVHALSSVSLGHVAVWGGGGTLNVIREVLPEADFYSLRTGMNRNHQHRSLPPDTVLWAVGRSLAEVNDPPESWRPRLVVDLNYADDSPGRAYALSKGAQYISGLAMFHAQAEAQREFWRHTGATE